MKCIGDTASDTGFLKYWLYTWRYHKSIADTSNNDTSIAILTILSSLHYTYIAYLLPACTHTCVHA